MLPSHNRSYNDAMTLAGATWHNLIPSHCTDEGKRQLIAMLLDSQDKAFTTFTNGSRLIQLAGGATPALEALAAAMDASPLWRLVSIQPMIGAVSPVVYYEAKRIEDHDPASIPTLTINTVHQDLCSYTRALVRFRQGEPARQVFERGLTAVAREVLGGLYEAAETKLIAPGITTGDLDDELNRASNLVYKLGQRAPANWIVTGPGIFEILKSSERFVRAESLLEDLARASEDHAEDRVYFAGTYGRRWHVVVDTKFPPREVLLGRLGTAMADASYIYAPYYFTTHDIADSDEHMLVIRHSYRLVKPSDYARLTG